MQTIEGDCPALREISPFSDIDSNMSVVAGPISSLVGSDAGGRERAPDEISLGDLDE